MDSAASTTAITADTGDRTTVAGLTGIEIAALTVTAARAMGLSGVTEAKATESAAGGTGKMTAEEDPTGTDSEAGN